MLIIFCIFFCWDWYGSLHPWEGIELGLVGSCFESFAPVASSPLSLSIETLGASQVSNARRLVVLINCTEDCSIGCNVTLCWIRIRCFFFSKSLNGFFEFSSCLPISQALRLLGFFDFFTFAVGAGLQYRAAAFSFYASPL